MKIPVFIIVRDRVKNLRKFVKWLDSTGQAEVIIVNNDSTYPPLLEYLDGNKHTVYNLETNHSKWAPWRHNLIEMHPSETGHFAVCDPDMYPIEECPKDAIEFWVNALEDEKYGSYHCAGPAHEISDLSAQYAGRREVVRWEAQFWAKPLYADQTRCQFFEAPIDSSFGVFRKGGYIDIEKPAIRSNYPYVFRHETWYMDTKNPSEEDLYYMSRCDPNRAHWIRETQ